VQSLTTKSIDRTSGVKKVVMPSSQM